MLPATDSNTFLAPVVVAIEARPCMVLCAANDSPLTARVLIHGISDAEHAEIAEIREHASATPDAVFLPCFTGTVVMPAWASPSQSVISMRISRLVNNMNMS